MIRTVFVVGLTLAAVGMCAAWTLSYFGSIHHMYYLDGPRHKVHATCHDGQVSVAYVRRARPEDGPANLTSPNVQKRFGFTSEVVQVRYGYTTVDQLDTSMHAPFWMLTMLFAAYPAFELVVGARRRRRERRRHDGQCVGCGYDLTGNESGVCPECGTEIKRA